MDWRARTVTNVSWKCAQIYVVKIMAEVWVHTLWSLFTRHRYPIKNLLIDSLLTTIVESTYLNRDMCKFESSQKDESRWQSTDSSKVYRNTSAFKCPWGLCHIYLKWRHTTAKGCTYMMSLRMRHPDVGFVLSCRDWRRWPLHLNTKQQEVVQC